MCHFALLVWRGEAGGVGEVPLEERVRAGGEDDGVEAAGEAEPAGVVVQHQVVLPCLLQSPHSRLQLGAQEQYCVKFTNPSIRIVFANLRRTTAWS